MRLLTAALALLAPHAAAQTTDIAAMCTAEGGFGQRFGANMVEGTSLTVTPFSVWFDHPGFSPFGARYDQFYAVRTKKGRKIFRVAGSVFYPSPARSREAYEGMRKAMRDGGWTELSSDGENAKFADAVARGGVTVELSLMGQRVFMECTSDALLAEAEAEL